MSNAGDHDKPRASTRFRKGQSGNPRGRPRKQPDPQSSAFDVVIDRTLTIVQDGVPREVTVDEALQHKTYQDAIAGNRAARYAVLKMIAKREQAIAQKAPRGDRVRSRILESDPKTADDALLILGIACHDPRWTEGYAPGERKRLLLEQWAVKAALSRRAASKLTKRDLDEARRCTHEAETIAWPEAVEP